MHAGALARALASVPAVVGGSPVRCVVEFVGALVGAFAAHVAVSVAAASVVAVAGVVASGPSSSCQCSLTALFPPSSPTSHIGLRPPSRAYQPQIFPGYCPVFRVSHASLISRLSRFSGTDF